MASSSSTPVSILGKSPQEAPKDDSLPPPAHPPCSVLLRRSWCPTTLPKQRSQQSPKGSCAPGYSSPPHSAINASISTSIRPSKNKGVAVGSSPAVPSRPAPPQRETRHDLPPFDAGKRALTHKVPLSVDSQPPTRSWAAVTHSATKGYSLSYIPPAVVDNKIIAHISEEILQAAHPKWDECLVGYYIGKRLPFHLTEDALKHVWGNHLVQVIAADLGFYYFHIPDKDFRRKVLEGVPITVAKLPLILQQWHPMMELKKDCHKIVPVWVRLRNLPINLWSASGISALASVIGKPFFVDNRTEQMAMVAFACICIEINAGSSFPEVIDFMLNGEPRSVDVHYEWVSTLCPSCCSFGHRCADPKAPGPPEAGSLTDKAPSARPSSEWRQVGGKRNRPRPLNVAPPTSRTSMPPPCRIEVHLSAPQIMEPTVIPPVNVGEEDPPSS
ncbi:hypothetical protein ACJRO7_034392 [Eucalyptus globulus]|uniref:DUF4283 domain-containing protein n=1 Tax=Eucalyptus globulus TaxID=34317 RepID=A0ABD3J8U7_EUCGL